MIDKYKLLDYESRYELQEIYNKLERFVECVGAEYEEFTALNTTLYYLNNAINYEKKFLS